MPGKTFAELIAAQKSPRSSRRGEIVDARILSINSSSILLDIGAKAEGIVSGYNFSEVRDFVKTLKAGDRVQVQISGLEDPTGLTPVSLKPQAANFSWEALAAAQESKTSVKARVIEKTRAGLAVEVYGIASFIPNSSLGRQAQLSNDLEGKSVSVQIIDAAKSKNQLVLSERAISEKDEIEKQIAILKKLTPGEILEGKVVNVVPFGAFVEINKDGIVLTGLVHKSEISWESDAENLESGTDVKVVVVGVKESNLSLSIKRALKDPWQDLALEKDARVKGTVVRTSDRNVIIEVMPGIEGTIAKGKVPAGTSLAVGQAVDCVIESIDLERHRLGLSLQLKTIPIGYK